MGSLNALQVTIVRDLEHSRTGGRDVYTFFTTFGPLWRGGGGKEAGEACVTQTQHWVERALVFGVMNGARTPEELFTQLDIVKDCCRCCSDWRHC